MNFDIGDRAMNAVNDSPYSVFKNAESIPIWTGRTMTPRIRLASPKTLVDRIAKVDGALIKDIGKKRLITNLSEHADRLYNRVDRNSNGVHADEILEALGGKLPYMFLEEVCHKPKKRSSVLEPFAVASFFAYHNNPTNNEKVNRKSKIGNDRRHFRRNLEAHMGLHVFRDEEVQSLVDLSEGMLRNEGYPSENKRGLFRKYHGHLEYADDVLEVLFNGKLSQDGFDYFRPAQYVDEHGFAQSRDGRDALFMNRYNRPDDQLTRVAARETTKIIKRLNRDGTKLKNGQLFAEAQKRVISETIKRDRL